MKDTDYLRRIDNIRNDPWYYCVNCVKTLDQTDKVNPIKPFPADRVDLKLYAKLWQRERFIAVPKSRRMFMSWMNIILYTWDTQWNIGRLNAFASKKEDDSDELVRRSKFILDNMPADFLPKDLQPKYEYTFGKLKFTELNSGILGVAQGADQARQYTFSGMLGDEIAFWDKAQETYSAVFPTLEGGGRFTAISSPAPGFFKRLVFDQFETASDSIVEREIISDAKWNRFPMQGTEIWKNPKNKFVVFQLHYSADPKKREDAYRDSVRSGMPVKQYMQEYELQWESFAGTPVYPDFNRGIHGSKESIEPELGLPLLRGWDFGLTPACVVAQLVGNQLRVIKEFVTVNEGVDKFSKYVIQQCQVLWPQWSDRKKNWRDFMDPSGVKREDTDLGSCAKVLSAKEPKGRELIVTGGPVAFTPRKAAVEHYLCGMDREGPFFKIDLAGCPLLVRGFEGGYRYSEKTADIEPEKVRPLKDEHSHPQDGLQYIAACIMKISKQMKSSIPTPNYSFSKEKGFRHEERR